MTKQRIERLKAKIQESRERIMDKNPFFALMLMYLKFVAVYGMDKISTDGVAIYFSPDFLDKLYVDEIDFVLCHQILHIILGHSFEPFERVDHNLHLACDIKINAILCDFGFQKERYPHLGEINRKYRDSEALAAEAKVSDICESFIFNLYALDQKSRKRFFFDSFEYWGQKEYSDREQVVIIDIPDIYGRFAFDNEKEKEGKSTQGKSDSGKSVKGSADLKNKWKKRSAGAVGFVSKYCKKSIGDIAGFMERELVEASEPIIDWRKLLNNFIQEDISDYSFSPPDKRFADTEFFLPDFNEKEATVKDLLFMIDTSGSVDTYALTAVFSEIKGALEQFSGKLKGWLGFFDTIVYDPMPFETINDIDNITPVGGGGTDFGVVFDYVKVHQSKNTLQGLIIFTDGYAPYPDKEDVGELSVLWIIDNDYITPTFGTVARLLERFSE